VDRTALVSLPKAELHVHLELSIQAATAVELADQHGLPMPTRGPWSSQAEFVRECEQVRDLITSLAELSRVAEELVHAAGEQGTWWTEVTCAPFNYGGRLGPEEDVLRAVLDGLAAGCAATGRGAGVILAHNRAHEMSVAHELLELCDDYRTTERRPVGVVALGLVGDEANHPPEQFRGLFEQARQRDVNRVPHAGEADGPEAIRAAWMQLGAQRIAHGARATESLRLVVDLAAAGVCLDVCPTSNVALHASPSLAEHQLTDLVAAGVPVSVGSDCTYLMGVDLVDEYAALVEHMGLDERAVIGVARDSLVHSFAPAELRAQALEALAAWEAPALS
jgi:adenosine deaminase